jgi:F-type H+-transporting ATPase subunit delta
MSVIAKKYVKAIKEEFKGESLTDLNELLKVLSNTLSDAKGRAVLTSNLTSSSEKEKILLDSAKSTDDKRVSNFLKLLVKNGRIAEIPAISKELISLIAVESGKFEGKLLSSKKLNDASVSSIANGLSKKLGKQITLVQEVSKTSGIKVIIDELHVEISVSADRIKTDMINHILKAI